MAKKKIKKPKSADLEVALVQSQDYPQYISIKSAEYPAALIVIWDREEVFRLAYKLMSLASEM